jgi:hypothetical protein
VQNNPLNSIDPYGLIGWDYVGYISTYVGFRLIFMATAPAWALPVGVGLIVGGIALSYWDGFSSFRFVVSMRDKFINMYKRKFDEVDKMNEQNGNCGY